MIYGYADRFSVAPEETIEFKLSCRDDDNFNADIVRLMSGDGNPSGPGRKVVVVPTAVSGRYAAREQLITTGSRIEVEGENVPAPGAACGLHAFVFATLPARGSQAIISSYDSDARSGWWLGLEEGRPTLRMGDGEQLRVVTSSSPLMASVWYSVTASWSEGRAEIYAIPAVNSYNSLVSTIVPAPTVFGEGTVLAPGSVGRMLIAASLADGEPVEHFNGKLEAPKVFEGGVLSAKDRERLAAGGKAAGGILAHWDFSADIGPYNVATDRVADIGPSGFHARCFNQPLRGMTGRNWRGREEVYWHCPAEYGAIKFHADDLDDAEWETDVWFRVPGELPSGVYALHARSSTEETFVPFWVLPPRGTATAKVLLLFPTATYMAYANQDDVTASGGQAVAGHTPVVDLPFVDLMQHPELGRSLYDSHVDNSGHAFTSRRRPIITMRPDVRHGTGELWCLAADLQIVDWLETIGVNYDVATDEDLHDHGEDLLSQYNVVITGTHPEYYSERMLDGWESYLRNGGRAMYLGGNGFYWVIGYHPEKPHLIELRRGEAGARAWQAAPGELYLQTTGERSGIWRNRNRAPNKLFGVGTTAIGFDLSGYFVPAADWNAPEASFLTAGCETEDRIGAFGTVGGGAAGSELDRYDLSLGTPPHALLLASSAGTHSANYSITPEDVPFVVDGMGGDDEYRVRADLVYFTTKRGGAVFSASSISWCSSLAWNGYDNEVQRLTQNVLRAFAADGEVAAKAFHENSRIHGT